MDGSQYVSTKDFRVFRVALSEATPKARKSLVCSIQGRRSRGARQALQAHRLTIFNLAVENVC